jgi:hypothetical protein
MGKMGLLLLASGIFLAPFCAHAIEKCFTQQKSPIESDLPMTLNSKVLEIISYTQDIPGLNSEEFSALKNEILRAWEDLFQIGMLEVSGTDKDVRPYFVALQGLLEQALALELNHEVKMLKGFIHTPMPATPLCTKGEISEGLVDPSIEIDPARLFTVKVRTTIVRDYLFKGGDLYVVYPKNGFTQRTEEQQIIYKQELLNYPNHLFDVPLNSENIPLDLIGATYLFQDQSGQTFVFSIKMTQAKDPNEKGDFGLWFGPINDPLIQERIKAISDYMEQNGFDGLKTL